MRLLITDDDPIAIEILRAALEPEGYEIVEATNGEEALNVLTTTDVRLVISDWDMPVMNGLQLCQAIRRKISSSYVYTILLTANGDKSQVVQGMAAGADDFIVKPFNKPELIARVEAGARVLSLETRDMVIFALAKLAESRDSATGHHLERVQHYSRSIAQALARHPKYEAEIDPDFIRLVFQTSPLHDIGKVGIPDKVLLKPGKLTPEEFAVMQTHTTIGADTLSAALDHFPQARFLQVARDIAIGHHERWDGHGYPNKISGENIPLSARIVAVADVYDALTSARVYKDAFSHERSVNIIKSESGSHFDPDVVWAFEQAEADMIQIREVYNQ